MFCHGGRFWAPHGCKATSRFGYAISEVGPALKKMPPPSAFTNQSTSFIMATGCPATLHQLHGLNTRDAGTGGQFSWLDRLHYTGSWRLRRADVATSLLDSCPSIRSLVQRHRRSAGGSEGGADGLSPASMPASAAIVAGWLGGRRASSAGLGDDGGHSLRSNPA